MFKSGNMRVMFFHVWSNVVKKLIKRIYSFPIEILVKRIKYAVYAFEGPVYH